MSVTCIHHAFAVRVPAPVAKQPEDQFILVEVIGDSRCYSGNRRVRDIQISFIGPMLAQMANAIHCSRGFTGGSIVWGNYGETGHLEPEEYISKIRRVLTRASLFDDAGIAIGNRYYQYQLSSEYSSVVEAIQAACIGFDENFANGLRTRTSDFFRVAGDPYA